MMLTDSDMKILRNYPINVLYINILRRQAVCSNKNILLVEYFYKQISALYWELIEFERILERIQDRQISLILRCRYALAMTERQIAEELHIDKSTVYKILRKMAPKQTQRTPHCSFRAKLPDSERGFHG